MGGQFEAECGGSVVPDGFVGGIFAVPMAQEAFAHFASTDEKHFAFLVTEAIDAWGVRSFEFDPRLAPGVVTAFDSRHSKPFTTRAKAVRVFRAPYKSQVSHSAL
jgi:hypothetical protein